MPQILSIRWRPSEGVTITRAGERAVSIEVSEHIGTRWETPSPALADALMCLNGGADESVMLDVLGEPGAAAVLYHNLGRLRHYGLLVAEVWSDERRLATLLPRARNFDPVLRVEPSREWQLSRFAYLRRDGNDLLLECPEAPCVLQIQDTELVAWIAEAAGPVTPAPGTAKAEISALLGQLGFFVDPREEEAPRQRTWEFHDRLFHRKARHFDDFQPHGGTYRFRGRFPSEPAIRPAYGGETARLPVPASRTGRTLREVMEARRSRRDMDDDRPVTRDQVAELLYRVARVRETLETGEQESLLRSYPSGGAIHELEFYLAVRAADGLTPGFYHYGSADHALTLLEGHTSRLPTCSPIAPTPGASRNCRPSAWSSSPRACPDSPGSMRASPTRFR